MWTRCRLRTTKGKGAEVSYDECREMLALLAEKGGDLRDSKKLYEKAAEVSRNEVIR